MSTSPFINEFSRVIRGLDALDVSVLKHREPSCIEALLACSHNSQSNAREALDPYAKRKITEDAEWVYDDFLLFSFVCCFVKFGDFKQLIGELISLRRRSEQSQRPSFLQDAERLIQAEEFSAQSMFTVVIADFLEKEVNDTVVLRSAHTEAVQRDQDPHISTLDAAIAKRCKEVVAELSISSSMSSSIIARNLWKRSRLAAMIIYLSLITVITSVLAVAVWLSFFGGKELSSIAGKVISVGAIGIVVYLWKIKDQCYIGLAHFLISLVSGKTGCRAMRSFNS